MYKWCLIQGKNTINDNTLSSEDESKSEEWSRGDPLPMETTSNSTTCCSDGNKINIQSMNRDLISWWSEFLAIKGPILFHQQMMTVSHPRVSEHWVKMSV